MQKIRQKGFTLIELLVVIAIIGILATIVLVSLNTARGKARDTQRIATVREIQLAMEMYYDSVTPNTYPATIAALTPTYLPAEPKDPTTAVSYGYGLCAGGQKYTVAADLENNNGALNTDIDTAACTITGVPASCGDTTTFYYCVEP